MLIKNNFISPDDTSLFQLKHSAKEACRTIHDFYRVYHSLRYFREFTILRFIRPIPLKVINRLNNEFNDIVVDGKIDASPPLKEEINITDGTHEMPRLVLKFNKQSFGRLNKMIRSINEWVN